MIDVDDLSSDVVMYVAKLRQEAARYRNQRNGARREAERLRDENAGLQQRIASLLLDVADLRDGIDPASGMHADGE